MKTGWTIIYVMGSIWIVGMIMSIIGVPFGRNFAAPAPAPRVAAGPAAVAAPAARAPAIAAPAAPAAPSSSQGMDHSAMAPAAAVAQQAADQHPSHAAVATTETKGNQQLQPRVENGVKTFELEAQVIKWEVLPGEFVDAYAYNGQVPGPLLRVTEGDKLRVNLKNSLPEDTVLHFHGPSLPNKQDGVPDVTQKFIKPGESFTYEFTANPSGTFVYHTHHNSAVQEPKGLYGLFQVDPKEPRAARYDQEYFQVISEMSGFFTINGKAFPATEAMTAKTGERVLIHLVNLGQMSHPMHMHGHPFSIVATDGYPVQGAPLVKDTLNISPGERYDLEITANNPGTWVFHCHILSHVANRGVEPGGMISVFKVD